MVLLPSSKKILANKEPEKGLLLSFKERAGRAHSGRITTRHKGGGVKKLYRKVEFGQEKLDMPAEIRAIEYDPNRTSFLALIQYKDGSKRYILAPEDRKVGGEIIFSEKAPIAPGNRMKLKNIPIDTLIHNIGIEPNGIGKMVRGAGTAAKVLAQEGKFVIVQMPSGETRRFLGECYVSIGQISRVEHRFEKIGKAGSNRLKGIRPTVRGSAMTPKSHPHGGGEGRSPIGMKHPKTPWGKSAFGTRTRKRKHTNRYIIERRKNRQV